MPAQGPPHLPLLSESLQAKGEPAKQRVPGARIARTGPQQGQMEGQSSQALAASGAVRKVESKTLILEQALSQATPIRLQVVARALGSAVDQGDPAAKAANALSEKLKG